MANVIDAIINLIENPIISLKQMYLGSNRVNNVGDALETYVQDLFIGQYDLPDDLRLQQLSEIFSYKGNTSNPPDLMLKGGDAIEVKKIESRNSDLALNSSHKNLMTIIFCVKGQQGYSWQRQNFLKCARRAHQNCQNYARYKISWKINSSIYLPRQIPTMRAIQRFCVGVVKMQSNISAQKKTAKRLNLPWFIVKDSGLKSNGNQQKTLAYARVFMDK